MSRQYLSTSGSTCTASAPSSAVIDAKGKVLAKRNVPNGVEPILRDADLRQSGGVP